MYRMSRITISQVSSYPIEKYSARPSITQSGMLPVEKREASRPDVSRNSMLNWKACVSSCTSTWRNSSYEPVNGTTTLVLSDSVKPPTPSPMTLWMMLLA